MHVQEIFEELLAKEFLSSHQLLDTLSATSAARQGTTAISDLEPIHASTFG